jgi:2-polyprenyl-3-methyl-5-hydroxy-6-metoxy-1,4-benzoquinol methylase
MNAVAEAKQKFKKAIKEILADNTFNAQLDEAALPAYTHSNILIDYIFWNRVSTAVNFLVTKSKAKPQKVLDFGCGTGVLSYILAAHKFDVVSTDIENIPLQLIRKKIEFPGNIEFIDKDIFATDIINKKFDAIIALDVLEHIPDIEKYILAFKKMLNPSGIIIVSGPTENLLYKIGRKLAGDRFTGDYHVSNISVIKNKFSKHLKTKTIKKIIWPLTLFEIFISHE